MVFNDSVACVAWCVAWCVCGVWFHQVHVDSNGRGCVGGVTVTLNKCVYATCCLLYICLGVRREEQLIEAHREHKREKNRQKLDNFVPQTLGMCGRLE